MDPVRPHLEAKAGPKTSQMDHFDDILHIEEEKYHDCVTTTPDLRAFLGCLKARNIKAQETDGCMCPHEALMHDKAAVVPSVVISPMSEWGVAQTLQLLQKFGLYHRSVSVKSGGHGYFNGGTCSDIMIDLSLMSLREIRDDVLYLGPGCVLGQTIDLLAQHGKAVPHGDCFGVGAGGHFLTAGWDIFLTRQYGLGCQSVIGGRVVLWDGTIVDVDEKSHRDLLYAMRGGAAAGVGVVTQIQLRLEREPSQATWKLTPITKEQLDDIVVPNAAFKRAQSLPREISASLRFQYEPDEEQPCCSFNIVSTLSAAETSWQLRQHLGTEVASLLSEGSSWNEKTLVDLRLLPASDMLAANPRMLGEATGKDLLEDPEVFWSKKWSLREMARSYGTSISHWVKQDCDAMFPALYAAFESAKHHPCRERMSALIVLGGGRMSELDCAMPLGDALARFEQRWDIPGQESWCRDFTSRISDIFLKQADVRPGRPYRGDIWLAAQADDLRLNRILATYETRHNRSC